MTFERPSLEELDSRIKGNLTSRLGDSSSVQSRANVAVAARAQAGAAHGLYGFIDWVFAQVLPDSADVENVERHGSIRGLSLKPAAPAVGTVIFTGIDGAVIEADTVLQQGDGVQYTVKDEITISGTTGSGVVEAVLAGSASNIEARELTFVSPLADVDSTAVIDAAGVLGGVDAEEPEELRARIMQRWRKPPQGGSKHDYADWALQVPGVTRVWPSPGEMGSGTVTIRYVTDGEEDIFPVASHIETVKALIEDNRPVTAEIFVEAPIPVNLDFTIHVSPLNETIKQAIKAELNDLILREAEPGKTILLSKIREAVSIAAGEYDNSVVSPAANVIHSTGQMARLGTFTWMELA